MHCVKPPPPSLSPVLTNPSLAWDVDTAIAVAKAIEPHRPLFLEEPLPYSDPEGYGTLAAARSPR